MKKLRFNLFEIVRENASEGDERIINERVSIEYSMFAFIRVLFAFLIILEWFPVINREIVHSILYFVFFFVIWIEPLLFSIRGLWEDVRQVKMHVSAGCMISMVATINILKYILIPNTKLAMLILFFMGISVAIISYFLYIITYKQYLKMQDTV